MTRYEKMIQKLSQGPVLNNAAQFQSQWAQAHAKPATTTTQTQPQQKGGLEGLLGGLGQTIGNVGTSLAGLIGGGVAGIADLVTGNTAKTISKNELQKLYNETGAKGYLDLMNKAANDGKVHYTGDLGFDPTTGKVQGYELANEGKNQDAFKKMLYGTKNDGSTPNYAKAAGQALDAAATVSNFIPGANGLVGNTIQGAVGAFGQNYADTGGDLESALKSAVAGGAAGLATGGLNKGLNNTIAKGGKLANLATSKPLASTIVRGGLSGAVGGAVGGGTAAGLNGGDVLTGATQGAISGAKGGLVAAPVMYGANKLVSKIPGIGGAQAALNEMEQDYQAKQRLKQLPQQVAEVQPIEESLVNKQAVESEISPVEEPQKPINRVARPEKDRVYATQLMDDVDFDDGIRSVKLNNEDIANSVAKDTGLDSILSDKELFNATMTSNPDTDPTNIADQVLPKQTRDLISQSLDEQNLTPKSYKKNVINKLTDFILGEGNQGVETVYYRDPTDGKVTGNRRISNNSETYKMLYDEFGGKPSKEFISSTVDDYLSGRMDKVRQQKFENALEWDRNAFDSTNIPEKGFKQTYESTGLDYDNLQKALANDPTLRSRINKSLVDNSELTMPMLADERLKASENAMARQAQLDADYDARKAVAQAQADEINRANGWDEYDQYIKEVNAKNKSQTIPKISRERSPATDEDIYNNSKSRSYRKKEAEALLKQYNTVDKKTANSTDPEDTVLKLKDMGFSKKSKIEDISGKITGKEGKVSGLVKKVIENASPVDTTTGPEGYASMDDYVEDLIAENGLLGLPKGEATRTQVKAIMNKLPTHREGTIDFVDDGTEVFKVIQKLESATAEKRGRSGTTYATASDESLAQANVLEGVADELRNRLFDNADVSKVLTPDVAEELKSYDPNNTKWADYVDNTIMKAQDARQLRSAQSPWVRINKIIENGDMNQITYGGRVGNAVNIPTTETSIKNRAINAAANKILGSDFVINKKADYYENQARKAAGLPTESILPNRQTQTPTPETLPSKVPTTPQTSETLPGTMLPVDRLANAIGRAEGARAAGKSLEAQLANMNTNEALQATQNGLNGNYYAGGDVYGNTMPTMGYSTQQISPLTNVELGIQKALSAGDLEAVEYLVDLYSTMAKVYQSEEPKQTKLTATQQRANAAASSLQRLANMPYDPGYTLSGIPILGNIATARGNSYLSEAQSLAQQIGYMVSGANIKKEEAESIGKAYVPQPFDSEQIRNEKLQRAAEIIAMYQNGYAEE